MSQPPAWVILRDDGIAVRVKAVPGASRDEIVGALGDHLKVRVAAPPEGGRANSAIAALIAAAAGVPAQAVTLEAGASASRKVFAVRGCSIERIAVIA